MFSVITTKNPIIISNKAWDKMNNILMNNNSFCFLFSAEGGGCNGFNYNLKTIDEEYFHDLNKSKISPSIIKNKNININCVIDPPSEMLLIGTTIDYIKEDYSKNIFESKFTFTPKKRTCNYVWLWNIFYS